MTAAIATNGLTKDFGTLRAVDHLDLRVERGEVFGFLGPNGAGKTTTIRMLLDFLRPTEGSASVLGGSGADPEIRRRIGYLPGDLKLDRRYSTSELIRYFGKLRGGYDRTFTDALLARFELDPARPSGALSTGNRRKVGIVQAFMHRPELLILDEPTSGLDPLLQNEFISLVREEVARGATVFLSSHVLAEVEALADRVGVIRRGKLAAVSSIPELRRRARHRLEFMIEGEWSADEFAHLPGVVAAVQRGGVLEVLVEGSVDAVVKAAAGHTVLRVTNPGEDLSEMFMAFYQEGEP
jgi:ABC-2 type transport system ATP-binding protein